MNITLTNNTERQHDLAMAMVGQAPSGAKIYEVSIVPGYNDLAIELDDWKCQGPCAHHDIGKTNIFITCIEAMSLEQAKEHAAEVMASYMED